MRLLQIVKELSHGGGVEHVAFELQRAWRYAGIDSRVLTTAARDERDVPFADLVVPWAAKIGTTGRGRYWGRLLVTPLFTIAATLALRRVAVGRLIVSHGDSLAGDICVVHAVNKASLTEKRRAGAWLWMLNPMHLWVGLRDRYMIGGLRFRRYVALSTRVKAELQQHYAVPEALIDIIPNGVNIERFLPNTDNPEGVRHEFGIPPQAPLLLFVGHEFERKGLAYVIGALAHLPSDVRLLVIGAGEVATYRALADRTGVAPQVIFTGKRSDLPRIYAAADIFVFPTYYEAFPLVAIEAMAAGLPVFATRVGGIEDYLEDGLNGRFIERDAANIAAHISVVLADPALRQRLGEAARQTAERFAWPTIAKRYLDLFERVESERQRV